jgi:hypothetical protein
MQLLAQRTHDKRGEEDVETDMIILAISALLEAAQKHESIAQRMSTLNWPKPTRGKVFEFELQQVHALCEMVKMGGLSLKEHTEKRTLAAEKQCSVGAKAGSSVLVEDSLEELD